jgi:N utilization substance protein B
MISRRNIRVKVMQSLYTLSTREDDIKPGEPLKLLQKHLDESRELLEYLIYFITEVAAYSEKDSYKRSGKHLPSEADLNVNIKIAGNELLWKIKEDVSLKAAWAISKPQLRVDKNLVRKIYSELAASPEYQQYINAPSRSKTGEKEIVDFIFEELVLPNELFVAHIEETFTNWDDDSEMVVHLIKGYLQKPGSLSLNTFIAGDKLQFAKSLLSTVIEKREHLESFILPKLKNWDAERLAALDMILMRMGIAEFLFFETIPPKVTINEYIELAKDYSTAQSGQFVNGILDSIHKDLVQEGKLQKTDFRKA